MSKFKAWQQLECGWCIRKATGNATYGRPGYWLPSCGKHGSDFEPFEDAALNALTLVPSEPNG